MKRLLSIMGIFVLLASALAAGDVNGKWKGTVQTPDGPIDLTFDFLAKGADLTGTVTGAGNNNPLKIEEGKIEGDTLSFSFITQYQGSPLKLLCKATPDTDGMKMQMGTEDGGWGTEFPIKKGS